jgi:hypothetical protein
MYGFNELELKAMLGQKCMHASGEHSYLIFAHS